MSTKVYAGTEVTVDDDGFFLFGLTKDDFIDQVKDIITVGEFHDLAGGGQIIFT
jgi:hypothetical protein